MASFEERFLIDASTRLDALDLFREADAALAAKDAEIANRPFTVEQLKEPGIVLANMQHGTIATPQRFIDEQAYSNKLQDEVTRLTALNTAKGELIEFISRTFIGPSYEADEFVELERLRARIRSLENDY